VEAFLIEEWLGDRSELALRIHDEASVAVARQATRDAAAAQGLDLVARERAATVASELAHNQLAHARRGHVAVRPIDRAGVKGVEIAAADEGAGITDPTAAFQGRPRASGSLGVGLAAVREHAHELDVDVRVLEGTCLRARLFASPPERRREVGVYGRPYPGEPRSGDHACVRRSDDRLVLGVCDGLGHGEPARDAATAAMRVLTAHANETPKRIVEACHASLGPTRGAVMAVLAVHEGRASPQLELASVGNITVERIGGRRARRMGASSFVVGSPQKQWRAHVESVDLDAGDVLLAYSDGITSRASIADDLTLLREHPIVIAHQLVVRFARDNDDVLVAVLR